nr:aminotransferase class IV [Marinibactrum halimedae]
MDRGFSYGDGVFETIKIEHGVAPLWQVHWARLVESLSQLDISFDAARFECYLSSFMQEVHKICDQQSYTDVVILKIMVSRGVVMARGYWPSHRGNSPVQPSDSKATTQPTIVFTANLLSSASSSAICVWRCPIRLSHQPLLAGLKHLNKLEYVMAAGAVPTDYDDGLLLDMSGHVIEATTSNIYAIIGGFVVTPVLHECGVNGVLRRVLIEQVGSELGDPECLVEERVLTFEEFISAEALFVTNSVHGFRYVKKVTWHDERQGVEVPAKLNDADFPITHPAVEKLQAQCRLVVESGRFSRRFW